jgi:hypothetical protein
MNFEYVVTMSLEADSLHPRRRDRIFEEGGVGEKTARFVDS